MVRVCTRGVSEVGCGDELLLMKLAQLQCGIRAINT